MGQSFESFQPIFLSFQLVVIHISNTEAILLDQMLFEEQHSSYKLHCFSVLSKLIFFSSPNPTKINYPFEPNIPYFKIKIKNWGNFVCKKEMFIKLHSFLQNYSPHVKHEPCYKQFEVLSFGFFLNETSSSIFCLTTNLSAYVAK